MGIDTKSTPVTMEVEALIGRRGRARPPGRTSLAPIVVGGGKQSLPDNVRLRLELLEERRFATA